MAQHENAALVQDLHAAFLRGDFIKSLVQIQDNAEITIDEIVSERDKAVMLGRYTATSRTAASHA